MPHYIAGIENDAQVFANAVRSHWGIENSCHWVLDVAFREDESRVGKGHGHENLALLRHIALNLIREEKTAKVGVKNKRLKACWDNRALALDTWKRIFVSLNRDLWASLAITNVLFLNYAVFEIGIVRPVFYDNDQPFLRYIASSHGRAALSSPSLVHVSDPADE